MLSAGDELDSFVAAFEAARANGGPVDLRAFLPESDHPLYGEVLRELVRVDLEHGWERGQARSLEDYRRDYPELFRSPEDLQAVTFEEYRLRRQAGEAPDPEEYRQRFGVDVRDWPGPHHLSGGDDEALPATIRGSGALAWFYHDVRRSDAPAARRLARAMNGMPEVGTEFLGFHLLAELGRGSFARVYLARQGELADRPVALKVSSDVLSEAHTLAQLQHTYIVPIFSVHHADPFHAVCMPFLGSATLATVLQRRALGPPNDGGKDSGGAGRLVSLSGTAYVREVLRLAARLADGLAHAHERGILHRDLKPANVLLADDGTPMLLDFNLSEDTKLRSGAASVGGTLPYMAPEHIAAFHQRSSRADARADLYSLGVMVYELLTGRLPFPVRGGRLTEVLPRMIEDRRAPPPRLRDRNPAASPAVEAVVRRCLQGDPARRYQTARELQEDLERHLHDLPLRHAAEPSPRERLGKWARRHPRLTSSTGVAVCAAVLLLLLGGVFAWQWQRLARLEAAENFNQFRAEVRDAQIAFLDAAPGRAKAEEIASSCRRPLDRYGVLDKPSWQQAPAVRRLVPDDRERLRADVGELLFLLAALPDASDEPALRRALELNDRAESCYPTDAAPAALLRQRADLLRRLGRKAEADQLLTQADATPLRTPRDRCLLACTYMAEGRFRRALPLWEKASLQDPQNVWTWYGLGHCYDHLSQPAQAAACYSACIALDPAFAGWYFQRGLAHLKENQSRLACDDFDQVLRLRPDDAGAHVNRAIARLNDGRCAGAVEDVTRALDLGVPAARLYLIRARAREKLGDHAGAERDRADALRSEPTDDAGWVARGAARVATAPRDALADFERALEANPRFLPALESKAHVLSERLGRTEEAVQVLDRAVILYPEDGPARAARSVLLARLGKREAALQDAREALAVDDSPAIHYQVAGIFALTARSNPEDRPRALALLTDALRRGFGHDLIATDRDLDGLRDDPQFRQLLGAAWALRNGRPPPGPNGPELKVP
jgi:serine/threonine protein kinase/tetratricopeptide (TPR) repeat protein